jgi:hypothetical protein
MIVLTLITGIFLCKIDKKYTRVPMTIEGNACGTQIQSQTRAPEGMANNGPEYRAETEKLINQTNKVGEESTKMESQNVRMSHYDGICLKSGNTESWFGGPDNVPFVPDDELYTYFSPQAPLNPVRTDNSKKTGSPIDGKEGSPEKMFMFENNRASLKCCPSTFSTSTGCICTSQNQRDYISKRGINHNSSQE